MPVSSKAITNKRTGSLIGGSYIRGSALCAGYGEDLLSGMTGLFAGTMQLQRPGNNGFIMLIRFCQSDKQWPPVTDEGDYSCDKTAAVPRE